MKTTLNRLAAVAALLVLIVAWHAPARAESEEQELIDKAKLTAEKLLSQSDDTLLHDWMKKAKGVMVVPSLLKAGFVFGAEGGSAVLLARDPVKGWSYPSFYTLGSGSFGAQIGFQDSQVIFVIMTDKGLHAMIDENVKLGADASIAIGSEGAGVEGATTAGLG